jgi:hypothetical protein
MAMLVRGELTNFSHVSCLLPDAQLESLTNLAVNKCVLAHSSVVTRVAT